MDKQKNEVNHLESLDYRNSSKEHIAMCPECGRTIVNPNVLDAEETPKCFYCNRKKIQRF